MPQRPRRQLAPAPGSAPAPTPYRGRRGRRRARSAWFPALVAATLFTLTTGATAKLTETETADLFAQGKEYFRQANAAVLSDSDGARDLYRKAALRFERIAREGGIRNGKLYYNIGNAYFRMGDLGRAILNYRRAEIHIPNDPNLKQNLAYARDRRRDRIDTKSQTKILHTVFFWHYDLPAHTRFAAFIVCFVLAWTAAGLRLRRPRAALAWTAALTGIPALLLATSLAVEWHRAQNNRDGVVIEETVTARKGDSQTYEPSFKEPLHAGTEFRLREDRGAWLEIELGDGRTCWIPAAAAAMVRDVSPDPPPTDPPSSTDR